MYLLSNCTVIDSFIYLFIHLLEHLLLPAVDTSSGVTMISKGNKKTLDAVKKIRYRDVIQSQGVLTPSGKTSLVCPITGSMLEEK